MSCDRQQAPRLRFPPRGNGTRRGIARSSRPSPPATRANATRVAACTSFDARGHPRYRTLNTASDIFDLRFTWDAAERLTEVDSRDPASPSQYRISKSFTFGTANVGSNLQNRKLVSGWYPAFKASRLETIDALRYE